MRWLVLAAGLAIFAAFAAAVRFHFRSSTRSARFLMLSIASAASVITFGRDLWLRPKEPLLLGASLALFALAALVFAWAYSASRSAELKLIYEQDQPRGILRAGPYARIRHPFYTSYILYWSGCAVATLHPINIAYAVLLVPVLWMAAREEERGFDASALAADYAEYRRSAGLFWPKP